MDYTTRELSLRSVSLALFSAVFALCFYSNGVASEFGPVTVTTKPEGAQVTLSGDARVSGISPTQFTQPLVGPYRVKVKLSGYETHTSWVNIDPTKETSIDVSLAPKTSLKAGLRSVFIPGWGQRYAGQQAKGHIYTILTAAAAGAFVLADAKFDDKFKEYELQKTRYDNSKLAEERLFIEPRLRRATDAAYDAENVRRMTIGAVVGVWALNVIDAVIFFPGRPSDVTVRRISMVPEIGVEKVGVQFHAAF